jgi:septum formation protein
VAFEVIASDIPERGLPGEAPHERAVRLAREKARAVAQRLGGEPPRHVLGADTLVVLGDAVLGKPRDPEHAFELLRMLVGRAHRVVTGVALAATDSEDVLELAVESQVIMRAASERELRAYVATGESLDKAGAYAAQGGGRRFIARIEGSETNVVGLPVEETLALLRSARALR